VGVTPSSVRIETEELKEVDNGRPSLLPGSERPSLQGSKSKSVERRDQEDFSECDYSDDGEDFQP
jgi:hypothetical protein